MFRFLFFLVNRRLDEWVDEPRMDFNMIEWPKKGGLHRDLSSASLTGLVPRQEPSIPGSQTTSRASTPERSIPTIRRDTPSRKSNLSLPPSIPDMPTAASPMAIVKKEEVTEVSCSLYQEVVMQ